MQPDQLSALAGYQPPLLTEPHPFTPELVPSVGAPNTFTAPPGRDGRPDALGLTRWAEPVAQQTDPAVQARQMQDRLRQQRGGGSAAALGWVSDPARQPLQLNTWIEQVEALHLADASAATLVPEPPDLEALMQEWSPAMQSHIASSPLPDPRQDVDLPTFARMCCSVLDLQPPPSIGGGGAAGSGGLRGLVHCLHAMFALYLEFRFNPAFQHRDVFGAGGAGPGGGTAAVHGEQQGLA